MNLKKIKPQQRWLKKHRHELAAFARSEYRDSGRGMLVICVDGRLSERDETRTGIVYMTQDEAAAANPGWQDSAELRMVTSYDPASQFVIQFLWATGTGGESRWSSYVVAMEREQNDAAIMERLEIATACDELPRRAAEHIINRLSSYNN